MKASSLKLPQISLRYKSSAIEPVKITCSNDAASTLRKTIDPYTLPIFESFTVLFTNRANLTIGWMKVSEGGVSGTVVDARMVLKAAIDSLASGIILCHNHPSGNLTPSQADIELTRKVKEASRLFEITLLDHIILVPESQVVNDNGHRANSYFSFADDGLL